ncbi:MAG TPA: hypothetical protein DCY13_09470 [Verrucomicrobiales bacterium]|nr:hypothetical protein [Verrucomicrobiales bacterium]
MVVPIAGALIALILAVLLVIPLIRYRVSSHCLFITLLGVPLRWVRLRNIRFISDHAREAAEPWINTYNRSHRSLFIRKRRGLFRYLLITPEKPFVFKAEIEKAIYRLDPGAKFEDTTFYERRRSRSGRGAQPADQ